MDITPDFDDFAYALASILQITCQTVVESRTMSRHASGGGVVVPRELLAEITIGFCHVRSEALNHFGRYPLGTKKAHDFSSQRLQSLSGHALVI